MNTFEGGPQIENTQEQEFSIDENYFGQLEKLNTAITDYQGTLEAFKNHPQKEEMMQNQEIKNRLETSISEQGTLGSVLVRESNSGIHRPDVVSELTRVTNALNEDMLWAERKLKEQQ
jgi:hypothetical protein